MENNESLVSIGMPTYNDANYLQKALDSLLAQTYPNFELIISDNASDDETPKICQEYAAKDKRIRYFRQKENLGAHKNLKFVLAQARGRYFMWAADDDWWHQDFIVSLKTALDRNQNYGVAMSSFSIINEEGKLVEELKFEGDNNLTGSGYLRTFYKIIKPRHEFHYFFYGLFRADFLKEIINHIFLLPCAHSDRVFIGEIALLTHFYAVPEILFVKTRRKSPLHERHSADHIGQVYLDGRKNFHYVFTLLKRILTSELIPAHRKIATFFIWLRLLWNFKYRLFKEYKNFLRGRLLKNF